MKSLKEKIKIALGWRRLKKWLILRDQGRVAKLCDKIITNHSSQDAVNTAKKSELIGKKIIWQYWAQGLEDPNMPEVVRHCLESVRKNLRNDELLICLSDYDLKEYIYIPDELRKRIQSKSRAVFSDLLRYGLISMYGGCWLDATIFLTDSLPNFWDRPIFMYSRSKDEEHKKYWSNSFYYYFGWGRDFKVNHLNSIIFAKPNNELMVLLYEILLNYFEESEEIPTYFFTQILMEQLLLGRCKNCGLTTANDCIPHYLQQYLNDEHFYIKDLKTILNATPIHKLTYKGLKNVEILRNLTKE